MSESQIPNTHLARPTMDEGITVTSPKDIRGLQVVLMKHVEGHGDPNHLFPVLHSFILLCKARQGRLVS
jgi:hypothetical protein